MTAILYTSSREHTAAVAVARIAAADRTKASRVARERRAARAHGERVAMLDQGQSSDEYGDWCHICSRATDHLGEHTPEQIARWREGMRGYLVG